MPAVPPDLDAAPIRARLTPRVRAVLAQLSWVAGIGSTQDALLAAPVPPTGHYAVLAAQAQTAGRGRRGRTWLTPPGAQACLSVLGVSTLPARALAPLGLALGVAAAEAMIALSGLPIRLKWPNDLLIGEAKLAGLLVEAQPAGPGLARVVAGIGLNLCLPPDMPATLGRAVTDLAHECAHPPEADTVIAALINALVTGMMAFETHGFAPFLPRFQQLDALDGRRVQLDDGCGGQAEGLTADGALRLRLDGGEVRHVHGGEVSLRALP